MQNKKVTSIKITGGSLKGKILHSALLSHTRPTKAIVRESIFNTLREFIIDKVFLEVFAGYGSVGFEALSRGAKKVIFIEKNKSSFEILLKNVKLFSGFNINVYNKDSMLFLKEVATDSDILYFDPPFGNNGEYYIEIFKILKTINISNKIIIFEHISSFNMPQALGIQNITLIKQKRFGRTSISYYF
ncbi:16S rRNA (guanine(966)-N(2))-methyltransferase RsmD [Helicobacter sp. MIT 14-3879]|uniref:16S rRNA (guanine(966)-N(2))-methyltransferase RsmD n=1 Tax=Helicobacter sp. MIT 14-3879 TaxID=2040649 RepID=UPI000E1FAC1C|nr:16S rRNA (guanine(966)-N(2))-methyltransferase RsmD [Helicobacter sp. MIT 14-3879]RDU65203.1 16S rRNA (guanine(966)-N(2))-methyltransferase RsmD [Helicobacter sp. MIT 14-3879]